MDLMNIFAFIIVFGLLAALVGTLATGVLRIAGFSILVALALIIGTPYLQGGGGLRAPFLRSAPNTTTQPSANTASPTRTVPSNVGSDTSFSTTGEVENSGTSNTTSGGGTTNRRGVPAMW